MPTAGRRLSEPSFEVIHVSTGPGIYPHALTDDLPRRGLGPADDSVL